MEKDLGESGKDYAAPRRCRLAASFNQLEIMCCEAGT
jgi:hypothetical protein